VAATTVDALREIGLIVARELRKDLRSAKGILLFVVSLLGGTVTSLLAAQLGHLTGGQMSAEQATVMRAALLSQKYGAVATGQYLAQAPFVLIVILWVTVTLGAALNALMGFDAIAGDTQHRTVRFYSVRVRRSSYYLGKLLGTYVAVSAVTLMASVCVWVVVLLRAEAGVPEIASWGLRLWASSLPMSLAWCALATLLSSLSRPPILALLSMLGASFALFIVHTVAELRHIDFVVYLYPNHYDAWLVSPDPGRVAVGVVACFALAAAMAYGGIALFQRRDV
jgi:ABC-type transport system involved in multi-copper enzyme maturation permease subunit